eukprot:TRINITY_DN67087_c0_g1_i1.p1 TRINITY_DN67087_c0_g1~~TRINITY_DN67087_c0_g1_i1.p1  ORF type:complete len:784 (-),score=149.98 TRINITY_DN67087_c0_g1_i1:78-2429(-)
MGMLLDQRALTIQADTNQIRSVCEFTDSLVRELQTAEGTPDKSILRELLAKSLRRALEIAGLEPRKRFLDALTANIHKFPLQEQQSLARVYPVEISSEYRNLQSFVQEDESLPGSVGATAAVSGPASGASGPAVVSQPHHKTHGVDAAAASSSCCPGAPNIVEEVRRRFSALTARQGPSTDEVQKKLLSEDFGTALKTAEPKARASFFSDLRLNLFKFGDDAQREFVERFPELHAEVARLIDSMTQEISRWLDEERIASQRGSTMAVLEKLRALFQAILSAPFLSAFKHLSSAEKRGKEAFLLKVALCLRACDGKSFSGDLEDCAARLRKQFFYVEGYGELMEEWLQSRIKQFNDEFVQKVVAATGDASNLPSVLSRLRRTFRPGRWLSLSDPQLEDDLYALFLHESFPRHILTKASIIRMLRRVSSCGGTDVHIYGTIARFPSQKLIPASAPPHDAVEASLLEVLQRFPPFPSLKRLRPGVYRFGSLEVQFVIRSTTLHAQAHRGGVALEEVLAEELFSHHGPQEFPLAAESALQSSSQLPHGTPTTSIEANLPALPAPPVQSSMPSSVSPQLPQHQLTPQHLPPQQSSQQQLPPPPFPQQQLPHQRSPQHDAFQQQLPVPLFLFSSAPGGGSCSVSCSAAAPPTAATPSPGLGCVPAHVQQPPQTQHALQPHHLQQILPGSPLVGQTMPAIDPGTTEWHGLRTSVATPVVRYEPYPVMPPQTSAGGCMGGCVGTLQTQPHPTVMLGFTPATAGLGLLAAPPLPPPPVGPPGMVFGVDDEDL